MVQYCIVNKVNLVWVSNRQTPAIYWSYNPRILKQLVHKQNQDTLKHVQLDEMKTASKYVRLK